MNKSATTLYKYFQPVSYELNLTSSSLKIIGKKLPPPSRRIALHQKGLKITNAKITRLDKKGPIEHEVIRINHLPTFEQARLHTKEIMYPGPYQIELKYKIGAEKLKALRALGNKMPDRTLLPSIDEPEAWESARII